MEAYNNNCIVCGKETKNKTFCSKQCQGIDFKNKQKKCQICSKPTPNKTYCSEKCQHEGLKGKRGEKWEMTKCLNCGGEIERLKTRKNKLFCSKSCKKEFEVKNVLGIFNPENRLLKFSSETKLKHSKRTTKLWESKEYREKVREGQLKKFKELGHWFGYDAESIVKKRKTCLEKYGVEVYGSNLKECRDKINETCLKKYGKYSWEIAYESIKGNDTKIEKIVENILINSGIDFIKQFKIYYDEKSHKYKVFDFFIVGKKILIEIDGDYWHGNPKFFKNPNSVQKTAIKNDVFKNELASNNNYKLLRYWENEIYLDDFNIKLINDINE